MYMIGRKHNKYPALMKTTLIFSLLFTQFTLFGQEEIDDKLTEVFSKLVKTFPSDSASLYSLYIQRAPTDNDKKQKHINRINTHLTEQSIKKYSDVEKNLKPLMTEIIADNQINTNQLNDFFLLYCDYDYFRGEAFLTKLLTDDENYSLVWESFRIIIEASKNDTIFLSTLLKFDDKIRTNVELAESINFFIVESVQNNPEGFLDMYMVREIETRKELVNRVLELEYANMELIPIFMNISEKSRNDKYKKASIELIRNLNDR